MAVRDRQERRVLGRLVLVDETLGHLMVEHDGAITWDELQSIKDAVWGSEARAIEVYPRAGDVVNSGNFRHLWRLGTADFCPDLLRHEEPDLSSGFWSDVLENRHRRAWQEAEEVFG